MEEISSRNAQARIQASTFNMPVIHGLNAMSLTSLAAATPNQNLENAPHEFSFDFFNQGPQRYLQDQISCRDPSPFQRSFRFQGLESGFHAAALRV